MSRIIHQSYNVVDYADTVVSVHNGDTSLAGKAVSSLLNTLTSSPVTGILGGLGILPTDQGLFVTFIGDNSISWSATFNNIGGGNYTVTGKASLCEVDLHNGNYVPVPIP